MTRGTCSLLALAGVLGLAPGLDAQEGIAARVARAPDGRVHLSFAARPGVCGDGASVISTHRHSRRNAEWEHDCDEGPVRVSLRVRDGEVKHIKTYVGGRWRPSGSTTDLGTVPAREAADYLLSLAAGVAGRVGKEAILPATLADSAVVWPELLAIARKEDRPHATRKAAVFWLGQAAGDVITRELSDFVEEGDVDLDVRKSAVFALSQRPHDEGVPALIRIIQSDTDPRLRKQALFWLGQSGDSRALALFEEILLSDAPGAGRRN